MAAPSYKNPGFASSRRLRGAKAREYTLVDKFPLGYRNREDITNLPPGVLVVGSQNVLTDVSGRIGITTGFTLDGAASAVLAPTLASYDYEMHTGSIRNLRACLLTSVGSDGKLQYRYVDSAGVVTWRDLLTSLTSTSFNFADYWDTTHVQSLVLMVNGAASITEWTGGITTVASVTANTITKSGTTTWAEEGFYTTGTHKVTINGVDYTATGGWATVTLTGVTPNPSSGGVVAGDIAHQTPETTLNSAMTGQPLTQNNLIANLRNQIYVGSFINRSVYVSKVNDYKNYSYTSPVRIVGEGAIVTLDGNPIGFKPQEDRMYMSAGKDQWYQTRFTLSADLTSEAFQIDRLETTTQQGAQSQAFISKIANKVVFLSNEPIIRSFGRITGVVLTPQFTDLSYSIINDMTGYDFTDGCIFYWRNFILVAIPKSSLIRIYNQTNPKDQYWEAPVGFPVSRFSILSDGTLLGHSYQTSESYKLFTGYNFNGNPIDARAVFSFNNYGLRTASKSFNQTYIEGYISSNTTLTNGIQYDIDGCATVTSKDILGTDTQFVCIGGDDNSLGKEELGSSPLGGNKTMVSTFPPKFRAVLTSNRVPFYEEQTSFSSYGVDFQWAIIAFGPSQSPTAEGNNAITS